MSYHLWIHSSGLRPLSLVRKRYFSCFLSIGYVFDSAASVSYRFSLCNLKRGTLRKVIEERTLNQEVWSEKLLLKIFVGLCRGVLALHSQDPPLAHRDIKVTQNKEYPQIPKIRYSQKKKSLCSAWMCCCQTRTRQYWWTLGLSQKPELLLVCLAKCKRHDI